MVPICKNQFFSPKAIKISELSIRLCKFSQDGALSATQQYRINFSTHCAAKTSPSDTGGNFPLTLISIRKNLTAYEIYGVQILARSLSPSLSSVSRRWMKEIFRKMIIFMSLRNSLFYIHNFLPRSRPISIQMNLNVANVAEVIALCRIQYDKFPF